MLKDQDIHFEFCNKNNIILHISIDIFSKKIKINSYINNTWNEEIIYDSYPFKKGNNINLVVDVITKNKFIIYFSKNKFIHFNVNIPINITNISIKSLMKLNYSIEHLPNLSNYFVNTDLNNINKQNNEYNHEYNDEYNDINSKSDFDNKKNNSIKLKDYDSNKNDNLENKNKNNENNFSINEKKNSNIKYNFKRNFTINN